MTRINIANTGNQPSSGGSQRASAWSWNWSWDWLVPARDHSQDVQVRARDQHAADGS